MSDNKQIFTPKIAHIKMNQASPYMGPTFTKEISCNKEEYNKCK